MSSILTNNSAMVALQTLKSINNDLGKVQSEISTGKTVESAKDNAAVWAISKVMSSDVEGFKAISDSLSLGQATVGVALNGAESITDLLTEIKGKIVNSQESNVDRTKIQTDIEALTEQIGSIVGAAQFNGLNLLNSTGTVNILSSLDRGPDGTVTDNNIEVTRANLGVNDTTLDTTGGTYSATVGASSAAVTASAADGSATFSVDLASIDGGIVEGTAYTIELAETNGALGGNVSAGIGNAANFAYVANAGDTAETVAAAIVSNFNDWATENSVTELTLTANGTSIDAVNPGFVTGPPAGTATVTVASLTASSGFTQENAGALVDLSSIDVSTEEGADAALESIEGLIQTSIDTAAAFGSSGRQIDTQMEFVGKLTDLLVSGIGTLVDADMEAASAKLQALQTQQQLGVQALSIANQAPQTILSLFR